MQQESLTFPVPAAVSVPNPNGDGGDEPTEVVTETPDPLETCEAELCMTWSPDTVRCTSTACDPVVVQSTGGTPLVVTSLEIVGEDAARFRHDNGCAAGVTLGKGNECVIRVEYTASDAGDAAEATLVIHQNFTGPATRILLQAGAGEDDLEPGPDADIDLTPRPSRAAPSSPAAPCPAPTA